MEQRRNRDRYHHRAAKPRIDRSRRAAAAGVSGRHLGRHRRGRMFRDLRGVGHIRHAYWRERLLYAPHGAELADCRLYGAARRVDDAAVIDGQIARSRAVLLLPGPAAPRDPATGMPRFARVIVAARLRSFAAQQLSASPDTMTVAGHHLGCVPFVGVRQTKTFTTRS